MMAVVIELSERMRLDRMRLYVDISSYIVMKIATCDTL